ncbi:uncharacterized protein EDB91DRAFT_1081748 [Suillus paluster]|uniref:uncharacterized protein n=1 Tax=Suillus paluster TaxID=48578 RepID=UPI001B878316|nr:uncharacterized protein EDB91DRAFT_1081748 [Suillus paluster]KAG1741469.1 hypothetical protein EDB91DRAFT_1081748 [Suillus paluster]
MAWFANWHTDCTVANISWTGFDRMAYFGAISASADESPPDTAKFLSTLQQQLPDVSLSAATPVSPSNDTTGVPSTNLTSDLGLHWVHGVPSYEHSYSISSSAAIQRDTLASYPSFNTNNFVFGNSWGAASPNACGINQPASGDFNFWGLIAGSFLNEDGSVASGMTGCCSQTVPRRVIRLRHGNLRQRPLCGRWVAAITFSRTPSMCMTLPKWGRQIEGEHQIGNQRRSAVILAKRARGGHVNTSL